MGFSSRAYLARELFFDPGEGSASQTRALLTGLILNEMTIEMSQPQPRTLPEYVQDELANYEQQIRKYRAGEVDETKMQKLRLGMASAELIPGMTAKGIPASTSAFGLLAATPK